MKKHNVPELVGDVLREIGETPETAGWDCHGTFVLLHKALERVAAHKEITFDAPTIVQSDINSKTVAVLVTGHLGDKSEWSFGEAAPYNNKNAYPFAMAEKRAKDRVILKLVGLHGYVYSEDEADDFKEARPAITEEIIYQTEIDAQELLLAYNAVVREHIGTINAIKDALAVDDFETAAEEWGQLNDEEKRSIWKAPSKGGMFTTKEIATMKTSDFREAGIAVSH
jgi:hypothetical protein|tara:strand:+ start:37 stop:714 length:678 start_codon:yes stop_codon:yes gene_type:complete